VRTRPRPSTLFAPLPLPRVELFAQQLGNQQELFKRLHFQMRRFGEGRVVIINGRGNRVSRGMLSVILLPDIFRDTSSYPLTFCCRAPTTINQIRDLIVNQIHDAL